MKKRTLVITVLFILIVLTNFAQERSSFQYLSPIPDSKLHSRTTNIIFSHDEAVDGFSLDKNLIRVTGSVSGNHDGEFILSGDDRTIIFKPYNKFAAGEQVIVSLNSGIKTI